MNVQNRSLGSRAFDTINVVAMVGVIIATLYPMYYILIISISDGKEVLSGTVRFFPRGINFSSYALVMEDPEILRSILNSIFYTTFGTAINLSFTALCAYPLSRREFSGRTVLTIMVTVTMFFQGGLIPLYLVVLNLGLLNTIWAILLVPAINTWYMFIMRTYFQNQPEALHDAAIIDGANELQILVRIVIPLAKPILATLLLFYAVYHWNSFFHPMIFLNDKEKYPVQLILRSVVVQGNMDRANEIGAATDFMVIEKSIKYAVIMVSTLPILLVYPVLQKYFVKGVMIGSIKG